MKTFSFFFCSSPNFGHKIVPIPSENHLVWFYTSETAPHFKVLATRLQVDKCASIGNCKISGLPLAENLVLLSSTESGLQRALNSFAVACDTAGMKKVRPKLRYYIFQETLISVHGKWMERHRSRQRSQLHWGCIQEWVRLDEELDTWIGKVSAVTRALHISVVIKRELSKKVKPSIFKTVFVPILTYGHESWVMTKRVRLQVQASEMRSLQRIKGVTLLSKVRSSKIRKSLNIEPYISELKDLRLDSLSM